MKVDTVKEFDVVSNLPGEKHLLEFDRDSVAHLMGVLTNLYSDPITATIREIATNAWDSHIEAKQKRPIEVKLPTMMNPIYQVKDWGIGMSVEDLHKYFSKYGASTKRDTNKLGGMLGLGAKAPLAYTTQFAVVAIKDGIQCAISVAREEDGTGSMTIVNTSKTDEPNGVEVSVIVKSEDIHKFSARAGTFFSFWKPNQVLIDGVKPQNWKGTEIKLSKGIRLIQELDTNYLVMANIPYIIPRERLALIPGDEKLDKYARKPQRLGLIAEVPIGAVHITPSREALNYTEKTLAVIEDIKKKINDGLMYVVQQEINKASDHFGAVEVAKKWSEYGVLKKKLEFSYKGDDFPDKVDLPHIEIPASHSYYTKKSASKPETEVSTVKLQDCLWIEGYNRPKWISYHRRKLDTYFKDHKEDVKDLKYSCIRLSEGEAPRKWIDPKRIFQWEDIWAVKLETKVGREKVGTYNLYDGREYVTQIPAEVLLSYKMPLYWLLDSAVPRDYIGPLNLDLNPKYQRAVIVILPQARKNKFLRIFPHAMNASDALKEKYELWLKKLSKKEKLAMQMHDTGIKQSQGRSVESTLFKNLNPNKINDPELRKLIRVLNVNIDPLLTERKVKFGIYSHLWAKDNLALHQITIPTATTNYPLLNASGYGIPQATSVAFQTQVVQYVNSAPSIVPPKPKKGK